MRNILTLAALYFLTLVTFSNATPVASSTIAYFLDANGNVSIGSGTLAAITTGTNNIAIGSSVGASITTGINNLLLTTSESTLTTGQGNIILGPLAHTVLPDTNYGIGIGVSTRPGSNDVAIGNLALNATLTNGLGNVGIGSIALQGVTTGSQNVAVGQAAGQFVTNGTYNSLYGYAAGQLITSGSNNVVIGKQVASVILTIGSNNILVGTTSAIDVTTSSDSNTIHIGGTGGDWVKVTGTNTQATQATSHYGTFALPNIASDATHTDAAVCEDTTTHILYAGSGAAGICLGTSSARYKNDIKSLSKTDILGLKPVTFYYKKAYGDPSKQYYGFIAEDVVKVMPKLVGVDKDGKPNSVDMMGMVPSIVLILQQQQAEIDALKKRVK